MMNNDFEKAFSDFLDSPVYDKSSDIVFKIARSAFIAGWLAAGGKEPIERRVFELVVPNDES